ncbi:MAG: M20/M25/M40 family metallo-hydrolase [Planctomycetota bacterium]
MAIDRDFVLETASRLVRVDSRNPGLEEGAPGERELAEVVVELLADCGWQGELVDLGDNRANVVSVRQGRAGGRSLMINVHLDTVGVAGMADPFSGELRGGRIWGRGAQDTKGGLAAVLGAAKALSEEGVELDGDLVLAFVADEEHRSLGTERLLEDVTTDAGIVIEPTELDLCVAHRGFGLFQAHTRGRAAHGGSPQLGIDANRRMGHVLVALEELEARWSAGAGHVLLGSPSLHVPRLAGGRQLFMYADRCTADVECRTVPGLTRATVLADLEAALAFPGFEVELEETQWQEPYAIDPARPIVELVQRVASAVRNEPARLIGHPWWEDSALLGAAGIETLVLGPTGSGLHTEEEWVDAESLVRLAEILRRSAIEWCSLAP